MRRRKRDVAAEECPRCGAKIGERCRSYKGRECAPHAIGEKEDEPHTDRRNGEGADPQQQQMFPTEGPYQ
jgi:hypothetical protein